jgi:hypothetical protein
MSLTFLYLPLDFPNPLLGSGSVDKINALIRNGSLFACGSMVLSDQICTVFLREAQKNRTPIGMQYRSAEG